MKKFRSLILILIVAMAFMIAPAFAEATVAPETQESVFQGGYSDDGLEGFASIVYGTLKDEAEEFGIELNYYGSSVWADVVASRTLKANAASDAGDFGIALFNLRDGYYAARAFADGLYGDYVYFTVGDSFKADYTINYYFEDANGDYVVNSDLAEVKNGSIGATVGAAANTLEGYTFNEELSTTSGVITAEGLELALYYDAVPYDWDALEMGTKTMKYGEEAFDLQGPGSGHYWGPEVNYPALVDVVGTDWTEDGKFINFTYWQNPAHATQYAGSIIKMPDLDMDQLTSITIRFITLNDGKAIQSKPVYLRGNATVTSNTTAGSGEMVGSADGSVVVKTITKAELLATMPADDNTTLHTLYLDGHNYTAAYVLIDSIRIDSTQAEVVAHNANLATYNVEAYVPNGEGYDKQVIATKTALIGSEVSVAAPVIPGYSLDEDAANVTTVTVDGTAAIKYYYEMTEAEITYDFNGGQDAEGNTYKVISQFGTDALLDGSTITKEGAIFYGWATKEDAVLSDVDANGLVDGDTTFYAVWYEFSWLEFADAESNTLVSAGSNGTQSNDIDVTGSKDGKAISFKIWQNPAHASYTKGIIALPHVEISKLVSIEIYYYGNGNMGVRYSVAVNNIPATNAGSDQKMIPNSATLAIATLTPADIAALAPGATTVDQLIFSGEGWQDRRFYIDRIVITSTDERYPVASTVTYDFNGGSNGSASSVEVEVNEGEKLMNGANLVREGYTFFGWAKTATVSTFDEMFNAGLAAATGTVEPGATYYAVWYKNDWLEFNDSTANSLIVKGSYAKTHTHDFNGDEVAETVAGGRIAQVYGWGSYTHLQVLLPRTAAAEIASLQINAYATGFNWGSLGSAATKARWYNFCLNGPAVGTSNSHAFSKASDNGVLNQTNTNVATLLASENAIYGSDYLWYMDICATQDGDVDVWLDSIVITKK